MFLSQFVQHVAYLVLTEVFFTTKHSNYSVYIVTLWMALTHLTLPHPFH